MNLFQNGPIQNKISVQKLHTNAEYLEICQKQVNQAMPKGICKIGQENLQITRQISFVHNQHFVLNGEEKLLKKFFINFIYYYLTASPMVIVPRKRMSNAHVWSRIRLWANISFGVFLKISQMKAEFRANPKGGKMWAFHQ